MARGRPRKPRPADSTQQRRTRSAAGGNSDTHTVLPNGALQTQFQAHITGMYPIIISEVTVVLKPPL